MRNLRGLTGRVRVGRWVAPRRSGCAILTSVTEAIRPSRSSGPLLVRLRAILAIGLFAAVTACDDRSEIERLRTLGDGGDPAAMFELGRRYLDGFGVEKDPQEARACLVVASDRGHPQAPQALGWMHEHGIGIAIDRDAARTWYRLGAERGDIASMAALAGMALADEDDERAFFWLLLADRERADLIDFRYQVERRLGPEARDRVIERAKAWIAGESDGPL